jgi:GNAT superfamily N-acetyltransferase
MESSAPHERVVELTTGERIPTRRIAPEDAPALQRFHRRLSDYSVYLRHIRALPNLSDSQATYFTALDHPRRIAVVALDPNNPSEIIAVVRAEGTQDSNRAEYAALVADQWQGKGLGTALTLDVIQEARRQGITCLYALVLPENQRMLNLLRDLHLPERMRFEDGTAEIEIDLGVAADNDPDNALQE